ncbi:MAG: tRNA preQ1(34) S-adenosylmethionine ribosyltransferase-isomerase QueA [Alphaproteobacteria bacterium]
MRTDAFDFALPRELIAAHPVAPRDAARLLVVGERMDDRRVRDLPSLLEPGDILVFNDTRVIPARLSGVRSGAPGNERGKAKVELTIHRQEEPAVWRAFARPAKRLKPGDRVRFAGDFGCEIVARLEEGEVRLRFDRAGDDLRAALERFGAMPLPPYIPRPRGPDARDRADYQTMFAREDGAVAAPTAGLHFTPELQAALAARGIKYATLTLHVGAGTFLPVKVDDIRDHPMHAETGHITREAAAAINEARAAGGRVVAVGSTSLRLLETAAGSDGTIRPFDGSTDIFITPGYRFKAVDLLLTNFHLPRSTLFMLVCAFASTVRMKQAYAHAIAAKYRFFSYGDACLLYRGDEA